MFRIYLVAVDKLTGDWKVYKYWKGQQMHDLPDTRLYKVYVAKETDYEELIERLEREKTREELNKRFLEEGLNEVAD